MRHLLPFVHHGVESMIIRDHQAPRQYVKKLRDHRFEFQSLNGQGLPGTEKSIQVERESHKSAALERDQLERPSRRPVTILPLREGIGSGT